MNVLLRSASVLVLATAALAAHADVLYTFSGQSTIVGDRNVSALAPDFVTSTTTFVPPALSGGRTGSGASAASSATFTLSGGSTFQLGYSYANGGGDSFSLPTSVLTTPGTYAFDFFGPATFTTRVVATPEPSALAALGLGAVAFVKRRKKG